MIAFCFRRLPIEKQNGARTCGWLRGSRKQNMCRTEWRTGKTVCIPYSLFSQTPHTTLLDQRDKSQLLILACFLYLPLYLCQFCSQDSSGRTLQNIKSFFHIKQQYKSYCHHNHNLTHNKSALTSAWLWTDSLESELSVPSVDPRRLRLFALRTIVATVRQ